MTVKRTHGNEKETFEYEQQRISMERKVCLGALNPNMVKINFGWKIDFVDFRATMRKMYSRYGLPIVTENELGAYDKLEDSQVYDYCCIEYLSQNIQQICEAIIDGCEVMNYCPWSAINLISSYQG